MGKYTVVLSDEAIRDVDGVYDYIANEIKQPETAYRYKATLIREIQRLASHANSVGSNEYVRTMFGIGARRIIVKKMAVIFFIKDDFVYVKRVIAGSMIH
jgi:plasmid stabilization system protein ParE